MYDALETVKSNGVSVDKIKNNKARNHCIVWDGWLNDNSTSLGAGEYFGFDPASNVNQELFNIEKVTTDSLTYWVVTAK